MHEVERKYEASGADTGVAGVADLPGVGPGRTITLLATYYDTPDHRLTDDGWVLRRRGGGDDAGWHLKRPVDADTRVEEHLPDAERLPAEFRAAVTRAHGMVPLVPVALLATERTESPVQHEGRVVATLAADVVEATASGARTTWAEVEVELQPGEDPALLDVVEAPLLGAGFRRAGHGSKIARALATAPRSAAPDTPTAPARDVLLAYLAKQVGVFQALEAAVLADEPDAVHKTRVATRRLRSLLRTFEPLLDRDWAEGLRDELKWAAEALGLPRDAEVLRDEFGDLLAEYDPVLLDGPVARRLLGHLAERHDTAHAALRAAMATPRHAALHARLVGLLVAAPWGPDADRPALDVLPPLVARARRRVEKLVARAERRPGELDRWHEVRKASKAVRYCTEALVDAFGEAMRADADRWNAVTEEFGVLQDAVVARELLDEVGALASAAGESTASYRVLTDAQDDRAAAALAAGQRAVLAALQG